MKKNGQKMLTGSFNDYSPNKKDFDKDNKE
jgi:hypothetical protein